MKNKKKAKPISPLKLQDALCEFLEEYESVDVMPYHAAAGIISIFRAFMSSPDIINASASRIPVNIDEDISIDDAGQEAMNFMMSLTSTMIDTAEEVGMSCTAQIAIRVQYDEAGSLYGNYDDPLTGERHYFRGDSVEKIMQDARMNIAKDYGSTNAWMYPQ